MNWSQYWVVYARDINNRPRVIVVPPELLDYHEHYFSQDERQLSRRRFEVRVRKGLWSTCDDMERSRIRYQSEGGIDTHSRWPTRQQTEMFFDPIYPLRTRTSKRLLDSWRSSCE